jgi:anthranilate/para-aminobenzoate synthase component II
MILIVDLCDRGLGLLRGEFVRPLRDCVAGLDDVVVKHYLEVNADEVSGFDRIILSGTALLDRSYLDDISVFKWLLGFEGPVLGVCAGMQVIGLLHGCDIVECKGIGVGEVFTVADNPLFEGSFKAYELHNLALSVNRDFHVLARSRDCVQAILHKGKPAYGLLFHPEARNPDILVNFIGRT